MAQPFAMQFCELRVTQKKKPRIKAKKSMTKRDQQNPHFGESYNSADNWFERRSIGTNLGRLFFSIVLKNELT